MWRVELDDYGIESCAWPTWKMEVCKKRTSGGVPCGVCPPRPAPRPPPPGRGAHLRTDTRRVLKTGCRHASGVGRGCCRLSVAQPPYGAPDDPATAQSPVAIPTDLFMRSGPESQRWRACQEAGRTGGAALVAVTVGTPRLDQPRVLCELFRLIGVRLCKLGQPTVAACAGRCGRGWLLCFDRHERASSRGERRRRIPELDRRHSSEDRDDDRCSRVRRSESGHAVEHGVFAPLCRRRAVSLALLLSPGRGVRLAHAWMRRDT